MENWRKVKNYVARFSSLLVSGVILSACYAPIVITTQSEVVTELAASEVVEMPLETEEPTLESTVTDTPTATQTPTPTFTPRPPPVKVDMETLELMASEWPSTDLYSVEQITFGDLLSISSKVYSGAGGSEATVEDGLLSHLAHQGIFAGDIYPEMNEIIQGPVEAYVNTKLDLISFADKISAPEPTATPTVTPTLSFPTPLPGYGLCPIDMELPGIYIFRGFDSGHFGLDIAGPHGCPHKSPGDCVIDELFIDETGVNGTLMKCSDIPVRKVGLGHLDFSYNDYETLEWFGISFDKFFNEDGSPKLGVFRIEPSKNGSFSIGEDLHMYMGTTGYYSALVHTHVGIWTREGNKLTDKNDPCNYLDCCN